MLRARGSRTGGGRDVRDRCTKLRRDKRTKLRRDKPRSFLGKVVDQVGKQIDEAFEPGSGQRTERWPQPGGAPHPRSEPQKHASPDRQQSRLESGGFAKWVRPETPPRSDRTNRLPRHDRGG